MTHPSSNRYSYTEVLERTVIIFRKYIKEFTILSIIAYSLASCFVLAFGTPATPLFNFFTLILVSYMFTIFQIQEDKKTVNLDHILFQKKYLYQLVKLIKPFLLLAIFLILLSFAFLIPAIIFGIFWSFWELIALEKNISAKEVLEYSKKLVSGNWWYIFIYFVITIFVSGLPSSILESIFPDNPISILLSNLITGFLTSFFIVGFFIIYRNLQKINH